MLKTQGKSSITISKTAYLDEMLPFPRLQIDNNMETYGDDYILDIPLGFEELIKALAAKVLTEEELVSILGNKSKNNMWGKSTYTPSSNTLTDPFQ